MSINPRNYMDYGDGDH